MKISSQAIETRPLINTERQDILSHYVEVPHPKEASMFCVDGRKGLRVNSQKANIKGPYLQGLGGSYHSVALNWLLDNGGKSDYVESANKTFTTMKEKGMKIGVHRGHHAQGDSSDCGFADNFGKIVTTLLDNSEDIWNLIIQAEEPLREKTTDWKALINSIIDANLSSVPTGDTLISTAEEKYGADIQNLDGEHGEKAAVVNLISNTTLDVDNNQDNQAFNLDLWHVLDQVRQLGMDEQKATLLSLGLYVATEMVLVEQKGKPRLPIIVRK